MISTKEIIAFYIIMCIVALSPFISAIFVVKQKGGYWEGKQ